MLLVLMFLALPKLALAQDALDSGDTAWLLTSTALVLFMTIPGLALFYGGLVRTKNVLSVLMQCFALTGLITIIWIVIGYSLAFDTTGMVGNTINAHSFIGGLSKFSLVA
jgi:Amt family ammonium transporter